MRPKKRILLVDGDDNRQSVRRYMLVTRGFAVRGATTVAEALDAAAEFYPALVIGCWTPDADINRLFERVQHICPTATMFVAERLRERPEGLFADDVLLGSAASSSGIVDLAKRLSQRKRGPKKRPTVETVVVNEERRTA